MPSWVQYEKSFITSGPGKRFQHYDDTKKSYHDILYNMQYMCKGTAQGVGNDGVTFLSGYATLPFPHPPPPPTHTHKPRTHTHISPIHTQ